MNCLTNNKKHIAFTKHFLFTGVIYDIDIRCASCHCILLCVKSISIFVVHDVPALQCQILNAVSEGIISIDRNGKIMTINDSAETLLKFNPELAQKVL